MLFSADKRLLPTPVVVLVLFALITSLSACDDPSSVGLELVGGNNGEPENLVIDSSQFENEDARDVTGGRSRVLAGMVNDPVAGTIATTGYIEFSPVTSRSTEFLAGPVTSVSLKLVRNYVYGDTLQQGTLVVTDVVDEWSDDGFPSDTTLSTGSFSAQASVNPTDSLIVVDFPADFVAALDTTLRSETLASSFHGIALNMTDANSVLGFSSATTMDVVSGGDTLSFVVSLTGTTSTRMSPVADIADRVLLQDTQGPTIAVDFDVADDSLAEAVLNRIVVQFNVDTLAFESNTPANFSRPTPQLFDLIAVTSSGELVFLETSSVSDDGILRFESTLLRATYQGRLKSSNAVDHVRLAVNATEMGLGVIALVSATAPSKQPNATLTVSRFQK